MKKFLALTIVAMLALACIPASALDLLSGRGHLSAQFG